MKTRILFDNYDNRSFEELKKEYIEINEVEANEVDNITESQVYDYLNDCNDINFEDLKSLIKGISLNIKGDILGVANIGRWNGRFNSYKIIKDLNDLFDFCSDCDYVKITIGYDLKIEASHHDGTNYITIREISPLISQEIYDRLESALYNNEKTNYYLKKYTRSLKPYFKDYI